MFQIEPIVFLQSFQNKYLTLFMKFITNLGYEPFFVVVTMIIVFGINFRKGFIILQIILIVSIFNSILKQFFALPRPLHVDKNLIRFKGNYPEFDFINQGAKSFFGLLEKTTLDHIRIYAENHKLSYGFPSGHVMSTTGLWTSISLLFRKKILILFTPVIIILMALSRMYLARHFLADVIGGAVFGLIIVFLIYFVYLKYNLKEKYFLKSYYSLKNRIKSIILPFFLIIIPFLILPFNVDGASLLLGINLSFYFIILIGIPDISGSFLKRLARIIIAFLNYIIVTTILMLIYKLLGVDDDLLLFEFIKNFIPAFCSLFLSYIVCLKFKLFVIEKKIL